MSATQKFFSNLLASTLGTIIAIGVSSMLVLSIILLVVGGLSEKKELQENSALYIQLSGSLLERTEENPLNALTDTPQEAGLADILAAIKRAESDDHIEGIYLEAAGLTAGYASIEAIRDELLKFKESGKFIIAYGDFYQQKEYYLCSVADQVILNPSGILDFKGLSASPIFFKNALDKVGVDIQVFKVGTFKSAVEPYILTHMSEANRLQMEHYLGSIWGHLTQEIATSRQLTTDQLNHYADQMMAAQPAELAVTYHLCDTLLYRTDVLELLCEKLDTEEVKELAIVSPLELLEASSDEDTEEAKDEIAVVYAVGEIDGTDNEGINSRKLVNELMELTHNDDIKGVVLRINSPGGSAFGSEQIWKAVSDLQAEKPVAISMGDYAASGGYYIAAAGNRIFAEPTTLTGSIGIFGIIPNAQKLLTDKIGITFDEVKTNRYGNVPNLYQPLTPEEGALIQANVERGYKLFVKRCAEGRDMTPEAIEKIAEGRVWSGITAQEIGLVDELGGVTDAIQWVAKECDLEHYKTAAYPAPKTWLEELTEQASTLNNLQLAQELLGGDFCYWDDIVRICNMQPLQARIESLEIE